MPVVTQIVEPEVADSTSYRTFLDVKESPDLLERVLEQLSSWLRAKKEWDPPVEEQGVHRQDESRDLLVVRRTSGDVRDYRAKLTERTSIGSWTTAVTVHESPRDESWIGLKVSNDEGRFAKVPWLVTYLLDALEVRDGDTWLSSEPRVIGAHTVEAFAEELSHEERAGLFLVAGSDQQRDVAAFDAWVTRVGVLTSQTLGIAQTVVLDPPATAEFRLIMNETHDAPPWTIRTFFPDVDPAVAIDGLRHRVLGQQRLTQPDHALRALLGRVARRHSASTPPPDRFLTVYRALKRAEDRLRLEHGASEPPRPASTSARSVPDRDVSPHLPSPRRGEDELGALRRTVSMVQQILGITDVDETTLRDVARDAVRVREATATIDQATLQLDERQEKVVLLEATVAALEEAVEEQQLEAAAAEETAGILADENRWLRQQLQLANPVGVYDTVPDDEHTHYPTDFAELATRLDAMEADGVVFTGDVDTMLDVDEVDTFGRLVRTAWDGFLVLADYVRATREQNTNGIKRYLEHTPEGYRTMSSAKFAEKETSRTMSQWGGSRSFPVPPEVHQSCRVTMEAHFKLGRAGMRSPRMYLLDRTAKNGKVYVGYIGNHLRNTLTN